MVYRREIDGLRALAVLPVILFHAGFQTFSGGFVGVDIFFVISGFLITSIILAEKKAGAFTLLNFYERRARRILPALFIVMFACLLLAWSWMIPEDLQDFSQSLIAVSTFSSNILFWQTENYFETAAELKPLLHTWSLAVEEQYYLLFPVFLMLTWRLGQRWVITLLALVFIISLAIAEWGSFNYPIASFYLLPTRGWELLTGAFIAFYFSRESEINISHIVRQSFSLAGLLLITYSIFVFDKQTPSPGIYTLVPTLGAALIILFATKQTLAGKLLGSKLFVGLGLISYSAYLWHQPLFAFARYNSTEEPNHWLSGTLAALAIILAYFSWKYVEQPFRNKQLFSRKQIFIYATIGSAFFITIGFAGHLTNGFSGYNHNIFTEKEASAFKQRFAPPETLVKSFATTSRAKDCWNIQQLHQRPDWICHLGLEKTNPSFFVFGDSHALSLLDTFDKAAKHTHKSGHFVGTPGCTPFLGIYALRRDQAENNCYLLNNRVFDYVKEKHIKKVFLIARWSYYTDGGYYGMNFSFIGLNPAEKGNKENSRKAFEYGLLKTVEAYSKIGVELFIVRQVPQQTQSAKIIYSTAYKRYKTKADIDAYLRDVSIDFARHQQLQSYVTPLFINQANMQKLSLISFDDIFCDKHKCPIGTSVTSFYADDDHLSVIGEERVFDELLKHL